VTHWLPDVRRRGGGGGGGGRGQTGYTTFMDAPCPLSQGPEEEHRIPV